MYSPIIPNTTYFRENRTSAYDVESSLFRSFAREAFALHGVEMQYYETSYDTSSNLNVIFAEDRTPRYITRKFTVQTYFELPNEKYNIQVFGMAFLDNIIVSIEKEHFTSASTYESTMTSAIYDPIIPREADLFFAPFNNTFYEIVSVKQNTNQFLKRQHLWNIEMKVMKNIQINVSATVVSAADSNDLEVLEEMLLDVFAANQAVSAVAPDVLYQPGDIETPPGPGLFNGW